MYSRNNLKHLPRYAHHFWSELVHILIHQQYQNVVWNASIFHTMARHVLYWLGISLFGIFSAQIKIILALVCKINATARHFACTYNHFSSNCECSLFISFYIRQSHKLPKPNGMEWYVYISLQMEMKCALFCFIHNIESVANACETCYVPSIF